MGELQLFYLMKSKGATYQSLGKLIGLDRTSVSRGLNGEQEMDFEKMNKVITFLSPEEERERMATYILNIKPNSKNLIPAVEYATINLMHECTAHVCNALKSSVREGFKEWGEMYELSHRYQLANHVDESLLDEVDVKTPVTLEMQVFKRMLQLYINNSLCKFELALEIANQVEKLFNLMEDNYIKRSYQVRVWENYGLTYLFSHKDIEKARYYINKVIEETKSEAFLAMAYNNLGHTYMFEDYDKTIEHFNKAIELMEGIDFPVNRVQANIVFLNNFWGKYDSVPRTNDRSEIAHYLIRNGQKEEGIKILDSLESESPYRLYYRWLATGNEDYLYESADIFKDHRNYFYLNGLIKPELVKIGYTPKSAEIFCK